MFQNPIIQESPHFTCPNYGGEINGRILSQDLQQRREVDSLVAVLFGTREGLWVDVSQGDVLVPLQVPHQNPDLWLHQTNPAPTRGNKNQSLSVKQENRRLRFI